MRLFVPIFMGRVSYTQRHKCETKLPPLDKEGRRWRKPARGGWNPRGTHHPSHGLRPWHPLLNRGGEYFVVALTSRIYVALYRNRHRARRAMLMALKQTEKDLLKQKKRSDPFMKRSHFCAELSTSVNFKLEEKNMSNQKRNT